MTLRPDGDFEYTSFGYTGNESGQYPNRIVFPEVVVPRSAGGAVRDRALHFRLGSEAALPLVTSANPIPKGGEAFRGL